MISQDNQCITCLISWWFLSYNELPLFAFTYTVNDALIKAFASCISWYINNIWFRLLFCHTHKLHLIWYWVKEIARRDILRAVSRTLSLIRVWSWSSDLILIWAIAYLWYVIIIFLHLNKINLNVFNLFQSVIYFSIRMFSKIPCN